MTTSIYSLSISARAVLNMHSLNNEGGEGNQIQTRMVEVIYYDSEGKPKHESVNAISGDMLKHIQAEHLQRIAVERELPLCAPCRKFDANRISADADYLEAIVGKTNVDAVNQMLQRCTLDDLEGILVTADAKSKRSIPRKSVAEFGWVIGVPGLVSTDTYFHVKYANERGEGAAAGVGSSANQGQTPFHRPASSGVYAIVCNFEIGRIGYNDITQDYASGVNRTARYKALLESALYTFVQLNGAMRNTQLPHLTAFHGVVAISHGVAPAPTVSPLNPEFVGEIQRTQTALNHLHGGEMIALYPFADLAAFAEVISDLIQTTEPYTLNVGRPS